MHTQTGTKIENILISTFCSISAAATILISPNRISPMLLVSNTTLKSVTTYRKRGELEGI